MMPGFSYNFKTFNSDKHLVSSIFVNKHYLTLGVKDISSLEWALNYDANFLQFKGFKFIAFFSQDSIHINQKSEIHPPMNTYFESIKWLFGMHSLLSDHYHFKCVDNRGNDLEITPGRLKKIVEKLKDFQDNLKLRDSMKKHVLDIYSKARAPESTISKIKTVNHRIKIFPEEEIEELNFLFLRNFCQPISTSLSREAKSFPKQKIKICADYDFSQTSIAGALPAPNSNHELVSGYAYSIVAVTATIGFFCIRKCLQKPRRTQGLDVALESEVKKRPGNNS